jgi:hypothetical protein
VACGQRRSDLLKLGVSHPNHGFQLTFDPALPSAMDIQLVVRVRDTAEMLPNWEVFLPAIQKETTLSPILVTASGRSGTTLLMGTLAKSQSIIVAENHPYEIRLLAYYATAFKVLTSQANFEKSMHPDRLQGDGFHVGFNPFSRGTDVPWFRSKNLSVELFSNYARAELLVSFKKIIVEYYERLRDDQGKREAKFFAEKTNNLQSLARQFPRKAFGKVKEIVLVRDPRDLLCSQRSYFKLDDFNVSPIVKNCVDLTNIVGGQLEDILILKYEDLVMDGENIIQTLMNFVGVDVPTTTIDAKEEMLFRKHATSPSADASIGRWRSDLPKATVNLINDGCAAFLERFGYPMS